MTFDEAMEVAVMAFEVAGVGVLVIGTLRALVVALAARLRGDREGIYARGRRQIGQAILLGLEVLIIADIVLTVTIEPTVESALTLGLIVLVRTFLSFSLEVELEGVVPWHMRRVTREETSIAEPPTPA